MDTTTLLSKLVEVERALQHSNYLAARALVMEAENCVLEIERDMIQVQTEKVRRATFAGNSGPILLRKAQSTSAAEADGRPGDSKWLSVPRNFSRTLVAAVRTSFQRLPYPI